MKTKEELNAIKEEVETVSKKLTELTEEELDQVFGGVESDGIKTDSYNISIVINESQSLDIYKEEGLSLK